MITAIILVIFASLVRKGLLVKPIPDEDLKRKLLETEALPVKNAEWLESPTGEWTVAIGLVAIAVSLFAFTIQDLSVLLTGDLFRLGLLRSVWYLVWAGLATLSSAACVFIYRSGWSRLVIALFSVAMASHILEKFVAMPVPQLRLVALLRLLISLGVVLVYLSHRSTEQKSGTEQE
jgi:hypothetical protein